MQDRAPKIGDRVRFWVGGPYSTGLDGAIGTITQLTSGMGDEAQIEPDYGQEHISHKRPYLCRKATQGYELLADRPDDPQTILEQRLARDLAIGELIGYRRVTQEELTRQPETLMILLHRGAKSHVVVGQPYLLSPDETRNTPNALWSQSYDRWEPTINDTHALTALDALKRPHWITFDGSRYHCTIVLNSHSFDALRSTGTHSSRAAAIADALYLGADLITMLREPELVRHG